MGLAERYSAIVDRVATAARAAGRRPDEITLVAVSKRQTAALVSELAALGHRDFGENLIQAWQERLTLDLPDDLGWHVIGPLQTNKAKFVARTPPALLHTVDRGGLVDALARRLGDSARLDVLLQVNIDRESQKAGCLPEALDALTDQVTAASALRLRGLMAIPRPPEAGAPQAAFAATRTLLQSIADRIEGPPILSMGMSSDFETAIAEGSTMVRIGTAIFGARE
jgi:pyridoxal phosphate enzyme (YggS family)